MSPSPRSRSEGRPTPPDLLKCVEEALLRRATLLANSTSNVARLLHGAADGVDGLIVEKLGDVLIVQLHEGHLRLGRSAARELCVRLARQVGAVAVYLKLFPKDRTTTQADLQELHCNEHPWWGRPVPAEFAVREGGVAFLVHPHDGYLTGLFLDHRAGRDLARSQARGRRVLNLFAYTCGFSVAAALGGAAATTSVDLSRRALEWGKRNLEANGLPLDSHQFIAADVFDYFRRAQRQQRRFDYIIADPPTFARTKRPRRVFSVVEDLERLITESLSLLEPEGLLQLSVNHRGTTARRLEQIAQQAARARQRQVRLLQRVPLPLDFRDDPDYAKSILLRVR